MAERLHRHPWLFAAMLSLGLWLANIAAEPNFGDPSNWPAELAALAPFAIVAMASTPSIVSGGGGLDISVGAVAVLANAVLIEWFLPHAGLSSAWLAVPLLLAMGAAIGAINGVLVAVCRYQPVIATLCAFFVLTGIVQKVAPSPSAARHVGWLNDLGDTVGPIPGALILIGVPLLLWAALRRSAYYRNLYAVGGNDATAFSAGVNVTGTRIIAYAMGGAIAAIAGIALTALVQSTQAGASSQYTLIALAAVALGGTPLGGGRGGLLGSLLGACCIYLVQTLLGALSVSSSWLSFVYGAMLVLGVVVGARLMTLSRGEGQRA